MDVRYINAFIGSICKTFETMCRMPVTVGKPERKGNNGPITDVSSIIGFSGDAAGSVILHFSFDTAAKIATSFAGIEITPKHPDFADALGELANMVAGGAKCQFQGLNISVSLPNVIVGSNHNVSASKTSPRIIIPCITEAATFHVEVGMVLTKPAEAIQQPEALGAQM